MENKDIDNLFANKFSQMPGDAYSESQWSSLSSRLDTYENRRRRWVLPVLLSLFALLAAGNVFWWYQWREAVRFNHSLEDATTLIQTDTMVTTTVVHRFDTIYQNITVVKQRSAGVPGTSMRLSTTGLPSPESNGGQTQRPDAPAQNEDKTAASGRPSDITENQTKTEDNTSENIPTTDNNTTKEHHADTSNQKTLVSAIPSEKEQPTVDSTLEQVQTTLPETQKRQSPKVYLARPRLSVAGAWSIPTAEHSPGGYLLGFGLGSDVEIARNLRLGAAFDYWTGKLEAQETEGLTWVDVPNPGNNYDLKHWETEQFAALTYALHLRYQIPLKSSWTPWVGLGAQATTQLPFDIAFEYENEVDDEEIKLTEKAETSTFFQGMLLLLGVEGKISPRFSLGAEGFWLFPLAEESGMMNAQLGLKTRLYYHF